MNTLTFAHISDLHLPFEPRLTPRQRLSKQQLSAWSWRRRRAWQRPEILDALRSDLQAQGFDHIVVTGDIINFSLAGEYVQAQDWLRRLAPAQRLSIVPGNHDALVAIDAAQGLDLWSAWTRAEAGWPYVHLREGVALIGLNSARPTAPLLAQGRLGDEQLQRLDTVLAEQGAAGRTRIVLIHHPAARGAIGWRKALADAEGLRAVLRRHGAELLLHGHARGARLDALRGPDGPIPCLCVPSSSALPNAKDEGARWHRLQLRADGGATQAQVTIRHWSVPAAAFVDAARYTLCLPRRASGIQAQ